MRADVATLDVMDKPILYDGYCGAGGASKGYMEAGFRVIGIDNRPQPRYIGDGFIQMDFFEFFAAVVRGDYPMPDAWHCSPPCQGYSVTQSLHKGNHHPRLVGEVRELLVASGKPFVIENVPGAPLRNPLMLCGSMFEGLRVYRHRLFECNPPIYFPPMAHNHAFRMPPSKGQYHRLDKQEFITCVGHNFQSDSGRIAMGIDWMNRNELAQAIPPAYTRFIGAAMMRAIAPGRIPVSIRRME